MEAVFLKEESIYRLLPIDLASDPTSTWFSQSVLTETFLIRPALNSAVGLTEGNNEGDLVRGMQRRAIPPLRGCSTHICKSLASGRLID